MTIEVFKKIYDGESLYDLDRDVSEAMIEDYNAVMRQIPKDENELHKGKFVVSIIWEE